MNACIASLLPAWLPPLMMLKAGTGMYILSVGLPASSAICLYKGRRLAAAPEGGRHAGWCRGAGWLRVAGRCS